MEETRSKHSIPDIPTPESPPQVIDRVGTLMPYNPEILITPLARPTVEVKERNGPVLQETVVIDAENKRSLLTGDTHALIFPMLKRASDLGHIKFPLGGVVLNIDFHADIAPYTAQNTHHTASWQRFGVDHNLWQHNNSFNCRPEHSTAAPVQSFDPSRYIREIDINEVERLNPEILSIDLDFFNEMSANSPIFARYVSILKNLSTNAKIVCVFSSSGWTNEKITKQELEAAISAIFEGFWEKQAKA